MEHPRQERTLWQFYWNMAEEEAGSGGRLRRAGQTCHGGKKQAQGEQGSGSYTGTWPRRRQALEDAYAKLVKLAMERRSRIEESRLLWQFHWDMATDTDYYIHAPIGCQRGW